jgi:predicted N-acetyltransferase YhbS
MSFMFQISPAQAADLPEIDLLLDAGFGPARHNRTAYRLRDGATPDPRMSFVARDGAVLVGSVQCWRIRLRTRDGVLIPLVLVGPVVTAAAHRGQGIATALIESALSALDGDGPLPALLIGDAPFYGRFGFDAAATGGWVMPGPVEAARLLLRWSGAPLPAAGWVEGKDGLRRAA